MTSSTGVLIAAVAAGVGCHPADDSHPPRGGKQIVQTFPAAGISKVILRAALAGQARIVPGKRGDIVVAGIARGGAPGYHPADSRGKTTSAEEWGLDFRGKAFGQTLVISTGNEIHYIHHSYYLDDLVIDVPSGTEVIFEVRQPTGDGAPDLREPSPASTPSAR